VKNIFHFLQLFQNILCTFVRQFIQRGKKVKIEE
jgi:hypothetical protein